MTNRLWTSTKQRPIAERLAEKIDHKGPDDCWPWLASTRTTMGHGQIKFQGRPVNAHRVAFMLAYGYLPPVVRHKCDNPPCCNPAHLEPGTIADNPAEFPHGTISRYRQGCRCEACKADNARVARQYRSSRKAAS